MSPLPDAELLVVNYLKAAPAVSAIVGTRVTTELPPNPVYPAITLTRTGGTAGLANQLDAPLIEVTTWAATKGAARSLAETARAVLHAIAGTHALGVVTGVVESGAGLQWNPDATLDKPRYQFQVELWMRGP